MSEVHLDLSGCKILIVDDVPANLDVLVQALDSEGYNILVASDGKTALEVTSYSHPDLILLDVMMPGMDGYETCRRLKADADLAAIPVVFLTARDDIEGIIEGFQAGGLDYVTKPFKKEEVLVRIRTHLERTILARELAELNARLEQKVEERTRQLQLKVRELEGKDRIAGHLLTFHSLEETLEVILEVVADVLGLDTGMVHLLEDGTLVPAAAIGVEEPGRILGREELRALADSPTRREAFAVIQESRQSVCLAEVDRPCALVPILRDDALLGIIEVENRRSERPVTEADLRTLESFALQAAVAIKDAQVRQDPEAWKDQLDEVLELEQEIEDTEYLEEIARELDEPGDRQAESA